MNIQLPISVPLQSGEGDIATFTTDGITYAGVNMRYDDIISVSFWSGNNRASFLEGAFAWIKLKTATDILKLSVSARSFVWSSSKASGKIESFTIIQSLVADLIIPRVVKRYLNQLFVDKTPFIVGNLRFTEEGIYAKSLFGERFCDWCSMPRAEFVSDNGPWFNIFVTRISWRRAICFYFYSKEKGNKIELGRMIAAEDNAVVAQGLVKSFCDRLGEIVAERLRKEG